MGVLKFLVPAAVVAAGVGLWLTAPTRVDPDRYAGLTGDAAAGEKVFTAAGCASCHHAPTGEDKLVLTGGQPFASDFGTFYAPNISPSDQGLAGWDLVDFANAVTRGVSPEGQHYYPAFPYTAYAKMQTQDVADLFAYMQTLPASDTPSQAHDVGFPFNIRRSLGGWKLLFFTGDYVLPASPEAGGERGRYLVEALAHCAECHTPRNALGGLDTTRWMGGAPNPSGQGTIPALTPDKLTWSAEDVAYYLESGFTPDYDSVGGHMAEVVDKFSKLSAEDRMAVAQYVKALPALD
ncbi:c-type cytochrome [Tropicibacter naphthalenivorans]|uniref:Nicotinate dehydrogenase subunit B n=1 Tax=Tropicibacter naphthalenivorans TaxID=441103 RepID=A0A0P1G582_9RHOB|nr:cytochrome c [Tropicibacter naphthalenivorans]CUH76925.1 Nicotinate dehydrogenase subunit B [Tropicibacter naphthalenivorans]SMC62233.1 Cytochrome c, mono-and diheme variants [Tropicibacter naphthalenivorans]